MPQFCRATLRRELQVAIVGLMHFDEKVDVTNALLRISDRLAFGATARHVYAAVAVPKISESYS
jgi:hypothetical protein